MRVLLAFLAICINTVVHSKRPTWPDQYQVSFNFTVPYVSTLQPQGLTYTYQAWQDYPAAKQKVVRDNLETVIIDVLADEMYKIFPAKDAFVCWKDHVKQSTGPTAMRMTAARQLIQARQGLSAWFSWLYRPELSKDKPQNYLGFILPDLSERRWEYTGIEDYIDDRAAAINAEVWEYDLTEGEMEMNYKFYVDADTGAPLKLWMMGTNLYTGGHRDEYIATFYDWKPGAFGDDDLFTPTEDVNCEDDPEPDFTASRQANSPYMQLQKILPSVHWGDDDYDRFIHRHGRRHSSPGEYTARLKEYKTNEEFIHIWNNNAKADTHKVALNRFADWTTEEYRAFAHGRKTTLATAKLLKAAKVHNVTFDTTLLPRDLIWKGTESDSPVKDQAACGSCWAFSAVGALESALTRSTGSQVLLSEQHLMDCAWGGELGNTACFGGDQIRGLTWILQNQGLPKEVDYPYRGVNDFCRTDTPKVEFKGEMVVVHGGEEALKEALFLKGPMAVSVDASSDEFRFYSSGVFSLDSCATDADDLDHAVLVSGYGTDEETGTEYWLVKNMWSPYWGEEGYIRIRRKENDCGIATQPIYIELDK